MMTGHIWVEISLSPCGSLADDVSILTCDEHDIIFPNGMFLLEFIPRKSMCRKV